MVVADGWDPGQYDRFREERQQPFRDLLQLVSARPDMSVVDLGCGTGETTLELHRTLRCKSTLGIDSSEQMLQKSRALNEPGLRFALAHVESFADWSIPGGQFDLLFSNACLHWVPEHVTLFAALAERLAARTSAGGGQLAVQMPVNHDHASHVVCAELCEQQPWAPYLRGASVRPVLPAEEYTRLLHKLGFTKQRVFVQVYGHKLECKDDVVEWVKGTLLTEPRRRLPPDLYLSFEAAYRARLMARLVDERPYFYPFKRLLLWAEK